VITPCNRTRHIHYNQSISIANNEYFSKKYQTFVSFFILIFLSLNPRIPHAIQVRRWKISYNQYRICYTGDLPGNFLRIKFPTTVQSGLIRIVYFVLKSIFSLDQSSPSTSYHFSAKLPTMKILKTQKIRAQILQNVLTQIEQGQTMKSTKEKR
jgi:hypothetical protein